MLNSGGSNFFGIQNSISSAILRRRAKSSKLFKSPSMVTRDLSSDSRDRIAMMEETDLPQLPSMPIELMVSGVPNSEEQ